MEPTPWQGGWYSRMLVHRQMLEDNRPLMTVNYHLLTRYDAITLHRMRTSDQVFHFHCGDPVQLLVLTEGGRGDRLVLSSQLTRESSVTATVDRCHWRGLRLKTDTIHHGFALFTVTTAPGLEWDDQETAAFESVAPAYPGFEEEIRGLCRRSR